MSPRSKAPAELRAPVPSVKMKAVHWAKITPTAMSKSIWVREELYSADNLELPVPRLEAAFCQKQPAPKVAPAAPSQEKSGLAKPSVVCLRAWHGSVHAHLNWRPPDMGTRRSAFLMHGPKGPKVH